MYSSSWHRLLMYGRDYLFRGLIPLGPKWDTWLALTNAFAELVDFESDFEPDPEEEKQSLERLKALEDKVVVALCLVAENVPVTEHSGIIHILLHVPAAIGRWNSVRNFWCYPSER
jgi:hypothetical protein